MNKTDIRNLFSGLCCSVCHHDFNEDSVKVKREEKNLYVLEIVCPECGKNFGLALLAKPERESTKNDTPFEIQECPLPINYDDVLNAHNFIDKLEKDWEKYIPDDYKL
ncbi:hypothetical protein II906_10935 [bacterium]|nr:hypothetical protein [bacterium]